MCGIIGIYSKNYIKPNIIRNASNVISHRGPNDEGFLAVNIKNNKIVKLSGNNSAIKTRYRIEDFNQPYTLLLGHKRLSIIELSQLGHQPMSTEDGKYWIVFNGEIYNYSEIREILQSLGYKFKSNSDTEVILYSYKEWGEHCVERFNGMWAFVIYDNLKNQLFISRDRFGVKPFYYFYDGKIFAFASEIKALLAMDFVPRKVNDNAVSNYLYYGKEENQENFFWDSINTLEPGVNMIFDIGDCKLYKRKYYELAYADTVGRFNENQAISYQSDIRSLIFDAVGKRLISDVPIGTCLSGGLDSSTIVCVANELKKRREIDDNFTHKTFTAVYKEKEVDESIWAKLVVDHTKSDWHSVFPNAKELISDLEDLVYLQDIPFGSTSIYAQYRVMKLAHENEVTVMLDGQGGDELFAGYKEFLPRYLLDILMAGHLKNFVDEYNLILQNNKVKASYMLLHMLKHYLPQTLKGILKQNMSSISQYIKIPSNPKIYENTSNLNGLLFKMMSYSNLPNLLRYEDRNSMKFQIEARAPFAEDHKLIDYVFNIPSVYKINDGWSKALLRRSMIGTVPDKVLWRKDKIGFATPEYYWLNQIKGSLKPYFSNSTLNSYIDTKMVLRDWDKLFCNQTKFGITQIWRLINLAIWIKVYGI